MSSTRLDLPEPDTPVTHDSRPSGKRAVTSFRLCSPAPSIVTNGAARDLAPRARDAQLAAQVTGRVRIGSAGRDQLGSRPGPQQVSAERARARPEVDDPVRAD